MISRSDLQRIRSLRDRKGRDESGLYAVEGDKLVGELLGAGHRFERILATDAWTGPSTDLVSRAEMARMSAFPTPSSVIALGRIERAQPRPGEFSRGLTLALDGVQDPGNVGTILRIADWYRLDRVLLSPECADLHSPKVIRASMGSFARVRALVHPLETALGGLSVPVVGCDLEGASVHAYPARTDAVIVIGGEGRGLSPATRLLLSETITIPRRGLAESLNAAVAAGIVCDNLCRG